MSFQCCSRPTTKQQALGLSQCKASDLLQQFCLSTTQTDGVHTDCCAMLPDSKHDQAHGIQLVSVMAVLLPSPSFRGASAGCKVVLKMAAEGAIKHGVSKHEQPICSSQTVVHLSLCLRCCSEIAPQAQVISAECCMRLCQQHCRHIKTKLEVLISKPAHCRSCQPWRAT